MNATELYRAGRLRDAIDAQVQEVRSNPADQGKRLFLFELLAFAGELDRARRQIDAIKYDEAERDAAITTYRLLLDSEEKRRRLFREGLAPRHLAESPEHVRHRLEAVNLLRAGQRTQAKEVLARANEACPAVAGQLNGKAVAALRDCDDLLGTVLEVFVRGEYFWIPLEQIDGVAMTGPRSPRDLLWAPARLEMAGSTGEVFLPALYHGSHEHADDPIKLGRATEWESDADGPVLGVGLRTFLADEDAVTLLEWRELLVGTEA
jgi:type VI secretion system protein ImpE